MKPLCTAYADAPDNATYSAMVTATKTMDVSSLHTTSRLQGKTQCLRLSKPTTFDEPYIAFGMRFKDDNVRAVSLQTTERITLAMCAIGNDIVALYELLNGWYLRIVDA